MYSEIEANKRKTWGLMVAFLAIVGIISWLVSTYWFNSPSTTVAILVMAAVYALISYFGASKMAIAMNGAKEVTQKEQPRIYKTVENLAITEEMPIPKVYIVEDKALNAFATGRDPNHAVVAATTGLLDAMDDSELEGVMAHELGHIKNYDIRVSMVAFALVAVIGLISDIFIRSLWFGRDNRNSGPAAALSIVVIVLAPIVASLMKAAISRKREYLADATGALTTRYPDGLANALEKIKKYGAATKRQNSSTAHLFFANPLRGNLASLFSTHPPVDDRIAKLRGMTRG